MENGIAIQNSQSLAAYAGGLEPAMRLGATMMRSGLIPQHFKSPEAVVAAIWWGQELGFSPMQALQALNVIQGKPSVSAAGLAALAYQAGGSIKELEHTETMCRLAGTRNGNTREFQFSSLDAERMGLLQKDNWKRMPKAMLYARCVSILVRSMFPDKVLGLYSTEELQDSTDEKPKASKPKTIETTATPAPEEVPGVVVADEAPEKKCLFQYDISRLDADKMPAAHKLLKAAGAVTDDEMLMLWESPSRIAKLSKFEVGAEEAAAQ